MCDYSLTNVRSRPAQIGDKLTVRDFGTGDTTYMQGDHGVGQLYGTNGRTTS